MEATEVKPQGQFLSPCPNKNDTFGDPSEPRRVGDQYQAQIPPMMFDSYSNHLNEQAADAKATRDFSNSLGLSVPIFWPKLKAEMKREHKEVRAHQNGSMLYPEEKASSPLPGSKRQPWSAIERASLVLALYLFEKDLRLVNRFIETKEMGDILSYYYGDFYRSDEHRRWAVNRKMRTRRCINGQKILSGWRHQELLSRLFSKVSEDCKNQLKEAATAYADGKTSLEEYVFALKEIAGTASLVDAVGIGKGKQDLTGTTIEPTKNNNNFSFGRPEVPVGKACAALTLQDIVKFLTGDIKLSKARANDLFWEAVWPRLLARGWHSEQPKSYNYASSKPPLVFLVPGVKKFSRRKLLKGTHFFDCVADVLNKVASEPALLEIDDDAAAKGSGESEENGSDDSVSPKRHCYLQPPVPKRKKEIPKFTVVDTSLLHENEAKIVEMRTLPVESRKRSVFSGRSGEIDRDDSEEPEEIGKKPRSAAGYLAPIVKRKALTACIDPVKFEKPQSDAKELEKDEIARDCDGLKAKNESFPAEAAQEEQPGQNGRRVSTRNRPLTTKALEAIACGFLCSKKRKTEEERPQKSRRVRAKTVASCSNASQGSADTDDNV